MRFGRVKLVLGNTLLVVGAGCGQVNEAGPDATIDPVDAPSDSGPGVAPVNIETEGTVAENGTLTLADLLVTTDADTLAPSLVYTVRSLPAHGMLLKDGVAMAVGDTFTQKDVDDARIRYVHDGAEEPMDGFEWELTDGFTRIPVTGTSTFAITVTPVNDAPTVVNNTFPVMTEAGIEVLSPAKLMVTDAEGAAASALTFTLVSVVHGSLQKKVGAGSFTALAPNQTFTQQDINDGNVRFVDSGVDDDLLKVGQNSMASFSWRVSDPDNGVSPSPTTAHVSTFTVTPVDDPPTATFHTNRCYRPGSAAFAANPLSTPLTDPDNLASDYQICVVSIGTGSSHYTTTVTTTNGGTTTQGYTETQIVPTLRNNATVLAANSCVPANALGGLTFTSPANQFGGIVTWRLLKGAVQVGANRPVSFTPNATCP